MVCVSSEVNETIISGLILSSYLPALIMILVISLSTISTLPEPSSITALTGVDNKIVIISLDSSSWSSRISMTIVLLVSPALKTKVPETGV